MQRVGQNKEHQHALPAQADEKEPDHVQNLPIAELELSPPVARMIAPFYGGDDSRSETERSRGSARERVRERERERKHLAHRLIGSSLATGPGDFRVRARPIVLHVQRALRGVASLESEAVGLAAEVEADELERKRFRAVVDLGLRTTTTTAQTQGDQWSMDDVTMWRWCYTTLRK